ncbi:aldehyde dehydrogenase family protein [Paenibacillus sp. sptzw28]|uniref:aldehyde dehydrogenase family protein n=1 Tax=Paenibacillus sp. sptzw28 TaxID=715179 RepID=UPI001C6EE18C|nr:aldehyde dehydrogenase family protein [Paenibacillus sp. sptzw28]QYR20249.1 aldehyde dehydrogenase family protein [Paenibacillus sp. sptzw28]
MYTKKDRVFIRFISRGAVFYIPESKMMCEEAFRPVVNIISYDSVEELVLLVNASKYGLQSSNSRADSMPYYECH